MPYDDDCGDIDPTSSSVPDGLKDKLRDFKGMAATIRFNDGAIELEGAGDSTVTGQAVIAGGGSADVVSSLPSDTGAVFGMGFADGWFSDIIDQFAPYTGQTADELLSMLSDETGLDLPDDAETLAGDSAALVIGSDIDPDAIFDSPDGSDVPVAVKIKGDPDEIEKVLDKLREHGRPRGRRARLRLRRRHHRDRAQRRLPRRRPQGRRPGRQRRVQGRRPRVRPGQHRSCSSTSTSSRTRSRRRPATTTRSSTTSSRSPGSGSPAGSTTTSPTPWSGSRPTRLRPTSATIAPVTSMRSAGAISTSRPRRPPET